MQCLIKNKISSWILWKFILSLIWETFINHAGWRYLTLKFYLLRSKILTFLHDKPVVNFRSVLLFDKFWKFIEAIYWRKKQSYHFLLIYSTRSILHEVLFNSWKQCSKSKWNVIDLIETYSSKQIKRLRFRHV